MRRALVCALAALLTVSGFVVTAPLAQAADVGFAGPSYGSATSAPTGQKPQSKLWVADGTWWGSLFDAVSKDFHIFRYDWAANSWADTGVLVDERPNMYMDTLWDGEHLYVISAGQNSTNSLHKPRLVRFSYSSAGWQRDSGYPVEVAGVTGGVKAAVIDKDSTGTLWLTYFSSSRVWVTHTTTADNVWVPGYQLPVPGGASSTGSDDLAALVAFDTDKIGVLWSNQRTHTMYWAWHQDGSDDAAWTLQVAYQQPEGADDHINLKSVAADPSGRVFAVAKTSMDHADDPLFNLLTLHPDDTWSATRVWDQADDSTRAIVQVDSEHRQLYVFAAAPCCAGGTIYVKKASMDDPQFEPGLGTPFIHSSMHPDANNPTSTKQHVTSATGLLVLASDDETRSYLYNRIELGDSADTTAPETTISSFPPSPSGPTATFGFTASEASTFACSLDGAAPVACTDPQTYSGLADGAHVFEVTATDIAGNVDPSPAAHSWTVSSTAPIFGDDFSSGGFQAHGWEVALGADGTAAVQPGAVRPEDLGARLTSTTRTGSTASLRKNLPAQQALTLAWDANVASGRSNQSFALAKIYGQGGRVLGLERAGSGALTLRDVGTSVPTPATVPLGKPVRIELALTQDGAGDHVALRLDGTTVFSGVMDLGDGDFTSIRLGDDATRRALDYRLDDVMVTG